MWKQVKIPSLDPVIYQGSQILMNWAGYCLAYVQTAFGVGWAGATAWESWTQRTKYRHEDDKLPMGVYVPIWFSHFGTYSGVHKNWGHVAIIYIYPNGSCKVWSSPYSNKPYPDVLNSIAEVERIYSSKYVGWSEDVNGVRMTENVPAVQNITREQLNNLFQSLLSRQPDEPAIKYYVGRLTYQATEHDILNSAEYQQVQRDKKAEADRLAEEARKKAEADRLAEEARKKAEEKAQEEEKNDPQPAPEPETPSNPEIGENEQEEPGTKPDDIIEEKEKEKMNVEQVKELQDNVEVLIAGNDFKPVISDKVKSIAYFVTDLGAILTVLMLTLVSTLGYLDAEDALVINAAITGALTAAKSTFRISSKK